MEGYQGPRPGDPWPEPGQSKRKTFHVAVVIRPGDAPMAGSHAVDRVFEGNIRAEDPHSARRGVLEQTWSTGCIVSRFLSVECLD